MKRIIAVISSVAIICLIPFSMIMAQEKKIEKKIKIIVTDDSGTKVIIDTLLKDGLNNDSIRLKNGKTIYIGSSEDEDLMGPDELAENIFVTVSSNGKENKKIVKTITIVNSDSANREDTRENHKIYVTSDDDDVTGKSNVRYKVISRSGEWNSDKGDTFYFNDGDASEKEVLKSFDVFASSDDKDSGVEKTRYVIAKDGIVVTVESSDEAKAKELIKEIENKLGVKTEGSDKKDTVKTETKKSSKK